MANKWHWNNRHYGGEGLLSIRILSVGAVALFSAALFAGSPCTARENVSFNGYSAGTIVIKTTERRLYYVTGDGKAIRYPVGVGKAGMAWSGTVSIDGKYIKPAWQAPESKIGRASCRERVPRTVVGVSLTRDKTS